MLVAETKILFAGISLIEVTVLRDGSLPARVLKDGFPAGQDRRDLSSASSCHSMKPAIIHVIVSAFNSHVCMIDMTIRHATTSPCQHTSSSSTCPQISWFSICRLLFYFRYTSVSRFTDPHHHTLSQQRPSVTASPSYHHSSRCHHTFINHQNHRQK
jgi:hypothetical protein